MSIVKVLFVFDALDSVVFIPSIDNQCYFCSGAANVLTLKFSYNLTTETCCHFSLNRIVWHLTTV